MIDSWECSRGNNMKLKCCLCKKEMPKYKIILFNGRRDLDIQTFQIASSYYHNICDKCSLKIKDFIKSLEVRG